ncbi:D2HGDH_3 [Blepharisma stoltei]|uniref:FAD-binding PCMH-type domain-containing protein n=1 Tax=Blepharisma stoltei TaxID=1481888 RepID=A0AAU9K002_9CILI|nr:unnamed protein product [Blepharisma stoltei]
MKLLRNLRKISTFQIPERGHYKLLDNKDIDFFSSILPSHSILTKDLDAYNTDWLRFHKGNSSIVLKPKTTEEVKSILEYCNKEKIAIVPQGGNTGQVIGSVPIYDEVILSLQNMNRILKIDSSQGVVWTEAGVILEYLNSFCEEHGWIVPLDLASKGSCFIGGNVATCAGGVRYIRYGSLHGNVLGLEAVLPTGEILSDLKGLRKDNTGYDYKQLFIGSEGTLGVITKIALLLAPKPISQQVAMISCKSYENVLQLLKDAKQGIGEILSAFEMMDSYIYSLLLKHTPRTRNPFTADSEFYVLIETSGSNKDHDIEKLQAYLENGLKNNVITDAVLALDQEQANNFWRIREGTATATKSEGYVFKYDLSLSIAKMYDLVRKTRERVGSLGYTVGYGHVGDGNLHLVVSTNEKEKAHRILEPWIYEQIQELKGSVSAEHGIGLLKASKLKYTKSKVMIENMKLMKNIFDPNGIMNPYKVLNNSN